MISAWTWANHPLRRSASFHLLISQTMDLTGNWEWLSNGVTSCVFPEGFKHKPTAFWIVPIAKPSSFCRVAAAGMPCLLCNCFPGKSHLFQTPGEESSATGKSWLRWCWRLIGLREMERPRELGKLGILFLSCSQHENIPFVVKLWPHWEIQDVFWAWHAFTICFTSRSIIKTTCTKVHNLEGDVVPAK